MKITLLFCLFCASLANAQWSVMQKYNEVGKGNYSLFAGSEKDAKRIILETLNDNNFSYDIIFNKGSNVLLSTSILDPLNNEYVYIIHCIKGRYQGSTGYLILCYYMENRYRYFYDVTEGEGRLSLIYDPAVLNVKPTKP